MLHPELQITVETRKSGGHCSSSSPSPSSLSESELMSIVAGATEAADIADTMLGCTRTPAGAPPLPRPDAAPPLRRPRPLPTAAALALSLSSSSLSSSRSWIVRPKFIIQGYMSWSNIVLYSVPVLTDRRGLAGAPRAAL